MTDVLTSKRPCNSGRRSLETGLHWYRVFNIFLFSIFSSIDFARWKSVSLPPYGLYRDLLTLCKRNISEKIFKNGQSKICGRQPAKIWRYMLGLSRHIHWNTLKAVFRKFYLVHSWIFCPICDCLIVELILILLLFSKKISGNF